LLESMRVSGRIPECLLESFVVPLFKKGDSNNPGNYRGIYLLAMLVKVMNKMILLRLRRGIDPILDPAQNAYRPGRCCQQHVLAAAQLRAIARHHRIPLIFLFVDFSKAFDSLGRAALRRLLDFYNVPPDLAVLILDMMDRQKVRVRMNRRDPPGEPFTPTEGILQGDTLAPFLFLLAIDVVLRRLRSLHAHGVDISARTAPRGTRTRTISLGSVLKLAALGYADDLLLCAATPSDAEILLREVERVGGLLGLKLNLGHDKTAYMAWNVEGPVRICTAGGHEVPAAKVYKYLGWMCTPGASDADWKRRRKLAAGLHHRYRNVWKYGTTRVRTHMFGAIVVPSVLYSLGTYSWSRATRMKVTQYTHKLLRWAHGVYVDTRTFRHRRVERLLPRQPFVTAMYTYIRLTEVGKWIRAHFNDGRLHPMIDVFMWEKGGPHSPRAALLALAGCDTFEELAALALNPQRWRARVEAQTLAEESSIALIIGRRREGEPRGWLKRHTAALVTERKQIALFWLAARRKRQHS
jgi:hypothetical protein